MEDIANRKEKVVKIAEFIDTLKAADTIVLDLTKHGSSWTDYFIITTVNSAVQLKGIYKQLQAELEVQGIDPLWRQKRIDNDKWVLIDCEYFVIHLMDRESRDFYELEKLWFNSEIIYQISKSS
ncbi:MAG: ribosome silencing factor [Spirochaetia bacterium]|jgi:ribosome-associated protein|nr:ribosome silencing factor [Spirochaetia bacterium]